MQYSQELVLTVLGGGAGSWRDAGPPGLLADELLLSSPAVYSFRHCPDSATRELLMAELVRIEKKYWSKGQSWGDQLPVLVSKPNALVCVLTADETVVAYAIVYVNALHAQLSKVFTVPEYRGRGIATTLVGIVLGIVWQRKRGADVTLFVEAQNRAAQRVYEKLGFEREREVVKSYYKVGSDAYRMVRKAGLSAP